MTRSGSDRTPRADGFQWRRGLAVWSAGFLLFETLSGLSIWILPFSVTNQFLVLIHTLIGVAFFVPIAWYLVRHWIHYRRQLMTHIKLMGYSGLFVLLISGVSGLVLTWQALFATRISYFWDAIHIVTTFGVLAFIVPHILLIALRYRKSHSSRELLDASRSYGVGALLTGLAFGGLTALLVFAYEPIRLQNHFPDDYSFKYGEDRPFAPSLAVTASGGAFDPRSLAGSQSCGTAGCHQQITEEWEVSAHRYSAMDLAFQKVQLTMAQQNGPESTRYCGGCHDPISLFSGTKNLYTDVDKLTSLRGYQEGVSCLSCHSVRETDLKGNAHYAVNQPDRYLFELEFDEEGGDFHRLLRDFLIRAYPRQHVGSLSKKLFKSPEYCAACHKQFIDEEINSVGWVQLQNQYDNWKMSRWNHPDDPEKTIECRECHMPLEPSTDPASGDDSDYNRTPSDGKHRSHRFIAANQMMPELLKLPGWEEQVALTEKWLQGQYEIPEIADKWATGPAVTVELILPEEVRPGEEVSVKTVILSNKVGHDFPTGPLDIIQAWLELVVTDSNGVEVYSTGKVDEKGFIEPGSFIFKAEPVDQYGNLIDRHNLWEMVGVRSRRSLFPGFSDISGFFFYCPDLFQDQTRISAGERKSERVHQIAISDSEVATLHVRVRLKYRKVDKNLLDFIFGADSGLRSPETVMSSDSGEIRVVASPARKGTQTSGL